MTIDCQTLCQNNDVDKDTDSREEIKGIKGKPNQKSQLINILLLFYKYSIIFI